ncbi:MAG: gliding motility-associated C-terminal domain-containing protein [Cyclobacteriaceae bacterium]|nr:gliding motility-associated C-terminal domain-containing protein [Cyclobacteriaceae bacterium]
MSNRLITGGGRWMGVLVLVLISIVSARATHLRAGEITLQRVSCTSLTFRITITVYTDTGSPIKFGDGELNFGDGSNPLITPPVDNTLRPDLGPEVGTVSYTVEHTFPGPGKYTISYLEANRNAGILNMTNSVDTRFYVETQIIIDPFLGCSNTPRLLVPPIDKGCTGAAFYHNAGAFDPDGDSLSYELTIPKREKDANVYGYLDPNNKKFYDAIGLNYGTANEAGNGSPTFSIDESGTLLWNAPGAPGEYNVAFLIKEWRKINGIWIQLGYVVRDMQIIIEDCLNQRPELNVPPDICVEAGDLVTIDVFGTDPDYDSVKLEAFSEVFSINPSPANYSPRPPVFQKTGPGMDAKLTFSWQTTCNHVQAQSYQVVFKVTDKSGNGPSLVQFKTWNIKVVGPAPVWQPPQVDLGTRSAILAWDSYACKNNASQMQIWRRVDQYVFTPPECVTGMPDFLGYSLINVVPIGTTTFTDSNGGKGLAVGAQYCYRLVAIFPQPGGGESYVSQEVCLPPILADAPVVTNVTVDVTDRTDGQVTVRWRPPFDADPGQYPPPYTYEVQRAEGFSGDLKLTFAYPGKRPDTFWVDTGINTLETVYNYRVTAYASDGTKVGVSPTASTVRLETNPQFLQIALSWNADVSWSNITQDYPRHLIYRGPANSTEGDLVLIDSVDVNQYQFHYIDSGQYQDKPLVDTELYCYRVMTRGAYGNPRIEEPLVNFSQIICAQPNDDVAPCAPTFTIEARDCEEYIQTASCGINVYSNVLTWNRPADQKCRDDIQKYRIYKATTTESEFSEIAMVADTFFVDSNLPSFAACYKISAVDRAGNESDLSESYCFDNCPYYELPNVFTPNNDKCNDLFSAFSDRVSSEIGEDGQAPCGQDLNDLRKRCARFVLAVDFKVYNRWGKEVYSYQSGGERSIYIDWDGRDNNGKELAGAVYYYNAEVTFESVDPSKKTKNIKGWVHLIR